VVATDRKLLWTLLILAGTVVGWALAVELEMDWVAMAGGAAALILLALIWFWPKRRNSGSRRSEDGLGLHSRVVRERGLDVSRGIEETGMKPEST
jgi:hypothetical protein